MRTFVFLDSLNIILWYVLSFQSIVTKLSDCHLEKYLKLKYTTKALQLGSSRWRYLRYRIHQQLS